MNNLIKIRSLIIIFLLLTIGYISLLVASTPKKVEGYYEVTNVKYKELNGGVEIKFKTYSYSDDKLGLIKVIIDEKYIYFSDTGGNLKINLLKGACLSLKGYKFNKLGLVIDSLCFESNTISEVDLYLGVNY